MDLLLPGRKRKVGGRSERERELPGFFLATRFLTHANDRQWNRRVSGLLFHRNTERMVQLQRRFKRWSF